MIREFVPNKNEREYLSLMQKIGTTVKRLKYILNKNVFDVLYAFAEDYFSRCTLPYLSTLYPPPLENKWRL
jgi:hypothetical protein